MTPIQAQSAHQRGSAFYNPRRVRSVRVKKNVWPGVSNAYSINGCRKPIPENKI